MLKRCFLLIAIVTAPLFANEVAFEELAQSCPVETQGKIVSDPILKRILAPGMRKISYKNIKSLQPILATKTSLMTYGPQNYTHNGEYFNGNITTIFAAYKRGCFYDTIGEQTVIAFAEHDFGHYYRSVSSSWDVELVEDREMIVHHHKYFDVYTDANTQFVKGK